MTTLMRCINGHEIQGDDPDDGVPCPVCGAVERSLLTPPTLPDSRPASLSLAGHGREDRPPTQRLHPARGARPGRHGRRLPGPPGSDGRDRRAQGHPQGAPGRRRRSRAASAARRWPRPASSTPTVVRLERGRHRRRPALPGDGVRPRPDAPAARRASTARCRSAWRATSSARPRRDCSTPTSRGWSTATSSRPTSWSSPRPACRCRPGRSSRSSTWASPA